MNRQSGFTLVEMLVAVAIVAVIGVVTTAMLFSGLTWRDRVVAAEQVEEGGRIFMRAVKVAVVEAQSISSDTDWLRTVGEDECWSFRWNASLKKLNYSRVIGSGCTPDEFPTGELFDSRVEVSQLVFDLEPMATGGQRVKVDATLEALWPLGGYAKSMSAVMINLVDEE